MFSFRGRMRGFRKLTENKLFAVYFLYAFGAAILLTLVLFLADEIPGIPDNLRPVVGYERCWVRTDRFVEFLYIYLPISIISLVNIILYSITAYKMFRCQKEMVNMRTGDSQKHSKINADKDR